MIFDGEKKIYILSEQEYDEMYNEACSAYSSVIERDKYIKDLKQKVIALIKDGRFVEALQELENDRTRTD